MKSAEELASILKNFKTNISSAEAMLARTTFLGQTEDKKKLPLSRFFQNSNSLRVRCAQAIAAEIVKNNFKYDRSSLPKELNHLIDKQLEKIKYGINNEEMIERINKQSHEQKIVFFNALEDKSRVKPR